MRRKKDDKRVLIPGNSQKHASNRNKNKRIFGRNQNNRSSRNNRINRNNRYNNRPQKKRSRLTLFLMILAIVGFVAGCLGAFIASKLPAKWYKLKFKKTKKDA